MESDALPPPTDATTLSRMLSRCASLLQARGCGVFIWDQEKNVLTAMRPFAGIDDAEVKNAEFPLGGSSMGISVLEDKPVMLSVAEQTTSDAELLKKWQVQAAISVPLALERRDPDNNDVVQREIIGVLCSFDKYYGRQFDAEDVRLSAMMARQVSAVLVTSQLYWRQMERTKRVVSILESTSVGLVAVSPKGTVTQVNASARRALRTENAGWFGRPYHEVISNAEVNELIAETLVDRPPDEPRELALRVLTPDGEEEERIYRVQLDQIRAEDGAAMGWVVVLEDVSDIRRAERMMAMLMDMVSHDLRTPLTSIRGFVATLLQAGEGMFDWQTQEEFLQIVDTEAERLGTMIDDFLNIARIQNGRGLQFNFTPVDVKTVLGHVVRLQSQSSYMKGNHNLVLDIPDDFPMIHADDGKLQQTFHNLVNNALKYSPNGGEVRISGRVVDHGVQLSVKDSGLGIPKEQLPKMFGQFHRVEASDRKGIKGTGLGLWLTKHMVEGHKGRIWVESDYGHGSTFHVFFPFDPNTAGAASTAAS
jgi:PAS domain S-box-containing protein